MKHRIRWENKNFDDMGTLSLLMFNKAGCRFYKVPIYKYNTNSSDKHIKNFHFITLTFRMLVDIHFQKYNRYKFLKSYLYCNNGGL